MKWDDGVEGARRRRIGCNARPVREDDCIEGILTNRMAGLCTAFVCYGDNLKVV
jgi:hypothetical protein